jgi:three-Cys-motif partner protein
MVVDDPFYYRLKKHFREKISNRTIEEWGIHLTTINSSSFKINHTGTVFKLYSLYEYLIYPYLHIIPNQRRLNAPYEMVYLDLFAGNGLNEISDARDRKYFVPGSPILAILASFRIQSHRSYPCYFDKMLLIDSDKQTTDILLDRCNVMVDALRAQNSLTIGHGYNSKKNIQVIKADITNANSASDLLNNLQQIRNGGKMHIMLFIDPPTPVSLELPTIKNLLTFPSDVIMLLHSGIFATQVKKRIYNPSTLQKMLGIGPEEANNLLESNYSHKNLEDYYTKKWEREVKNVKEIGIYSGSPFREIVVIVPLRTKESNYYLLYATRQTGGNSQEWQLPAEGFARWMGKFSDSGPTAISVLQGLQSRLYDFP